MKIALAALATVVLAGPVYADAGSWTTSFENGDEYTISADRVDWLSSPKRVWVKGYHRKNSSVAFRSSSQLLEFDCGGMVSVLAYATYDAAGNETYSFNARQPSELVKPNTLREWAQNIVC